MATPNITYCYPLVLVARNNPGVHLETVATETVNISNNVIRARNSQLDFRYVVP